MKLHSALLHTAFLGLLVTSCDSGPRAPQGAAPVKGPKAPTSAPAPKKITKALPALNWQYSHRTAIKQATAAKKPVLIYFSPTGDFAKVPAWAKKSKDLETALEKNTPFCNFTKKEFILLNMDVKYDKTGTHKRTYKYESIVEKLGINKFPAFGLIGADGTPKATFYPEGKGERLAKRIQTFINIRKNITNGITTLKNKEGWYTNLEMAKAMSKYTNKPIFAFFTGSNWCGYCKRLSRNVLTKPKFTKFLDDHTIKLLCDFPRGIPMPAAVKQQNNQLKGKFKLRGFPNMVVMDSNGEKLSVIPNYSIKAAQMADLLKKNIIASKQLIDKRQKPQK